jgi:hypothetical protein
LREAFFGARSLLLGSAGSIVRLPFDRRPLIRRVFRFAALVLAGVRSGVCIEISRL